MPMLTDLKRRDFFRSVILTTVGLLSKDLLCPSPARANESQQFNTNSPVVENYLLFVPYITAKQGGKIAVTLYSGKREFVPIPYHCGDQFSVTIKNIGENGNDCVFQIYTLYDVQSRFADKVYANIDITHFLTDLTKTQCKTVYEQGEDGKIVNDMAALELLDYVINTSKLDENIKKRYDLASQNSRLLMISEVIEKSLEKSSLDQENKTLLRGTFEYLKSGLPIPNFQALTELDSIVYNADIPDSLRQTYAFGSAVSRALTVDYLIIEKINTDPQLTFNSQQNYLSIYKEIRDGKKVSDSDLLQEVDEFILKSDLPENAKLVYLQTHEQDIDDEKDLEYNLQNLRQTYQNGGNVAPYATKVISWVGTEAATGVTISSLSGAAATNATLAVLGGGSVATGGLGMLGGLAVVTGGAALIGAAGIISIGLVSQMDSEDLKNLGVAVGGGTLLGASAVFAAWTAASALGVAGTLSGAAAITATMTALGGLSLVTGGTALVASGAAYIIWSFLHSHKKRDQGLLEQLETRLYTLNEPPIPNSFEEFIASQIQSNYSREEGFSAPNIPLNLLINAEKKWLSLDFLDSNEKVIALIDRSMWDDGKEGMVFSNNRVIWKQALFSTKFIYYSDIFDILNKPNLWKINLSKYQDLSEKVLSLSNFLYDNSDNEKLMSFLDEISQKYQLSVT